MIDTLSQRTILKMSNVNKIKYYVNLEPTNLTALEKTSFRQIGYFQAEIEIDDFKFKNSVFVINDNSIDFDIIIDTDVIHQATLIISSNDVKINKSQNQLKKISG